MPHLFFLLICVLWGSNFMLMKQAGLAFSGLQIAFGRVLGAALILGPVWWRQGGRWRLDRKDWQPFSVLLILGYAWPYTIQPVLVARHGGALMGMSVTFVPLLTVVLSIPLLGTWPTARQAAGVCGALVCLIVLLIDVQNRSIPLLDLALAATVPLGYSLANIGIRRNLRHVSSLDLSFLSVAWTAVLLLPLLATDLTPAPPGNGPLVGPVVALIVLGTLGTGLANWMFNRLVVQQGPLFAGMVTNLVPLGALLWGWVDRERVTGLQVAALAGLLVTVALVQTGAVRNS